MIWCGHIIHNSCYTWGYLNGGIWQVVSERFSYAMVNRPQRPVGGVSDRSLRHSTATAGLSWRRRFKAHQQWTTTPVLQQQQQQQQHSKTGCSFAGYGSAVVVGLPQLRTLCTRRAVSCHASAKDDDDDAKDTTTQNKKLVSTPPPSALPKI